ncbi:MAG: hypothetical protein QN122_03970 [Armatimonadota bacterium]|nr:hypothetical protein [Armatimonadota bacterium]MDR7449786.1 hypothetical protein [Armatimonadota bacterium]MDR7458423.1 hypothetical protein [Armatimonadota bacterium]MDR7478775.1 hypothetical protein [Armatimonadota bacterium]MDR7488233.1 hypothetical protein [Armatimonadota bacterium]
MEHDYLVLDSRGHPLAGPFRDEHAARLWIAFNRFRHQGPLSILHVGSRWRPTAVFRRVQDVPEAVWEQQARARAIVVQTADGAEILS